MRVLVATMVHDPRDARVYARQIAAMKAAGHTVTYIAPFSAFDLHGLPGVDAIDIPAARGRKRWSALRAARRQLHHHARDHDVVLLHSPELILAAHNLKHPCIVWDVHEDTAAAVTLKGWLPGPIRRPMAQVVGWAERWAERHWHLILAEEAYAQRFNRSHPVVANSTPVPPQVPLTGDRRAVYVGHVTAARGGHEVIRVGRQLRNRIEVHVIGHADEHMMPLLQQAHDRGDVIWHGYVPNADALRIIQGAAVGLSLLHNEPNYRHSRPTKLMEYWAQGIPVISTPLPLAVAMVEDCDGGVVVPFGDYRITADAVVELAGNPQNRQAMADRGRQWVATHADWNVDGPAFVATLCSWSGQSDIGQQGAGNTT